MLSYFDDTLGTLLEQTDIFIVIFLFAINLPCFQRINFTNKEVIYLFFTTGEEQLVAISYEVISDIKTKIIYYTKDSSNGNKSYCVALITDFIFSLISSR